MIKTFKLKDNKIILKIGDITEDDSDILINWSSIDLGGGPPSCSFNEIKEKAGYQFYYTLVQYRQQVKYTDAFTIIPGFLSTNIIVNCIIPNYGQPQMYNDCLFNIKNTIKVYSKNNHARFISLEIPDFNCIDIILHHLLLYFKELPFKELRIFVKDKDSFNTVNYHLGNLLKKNSIKTFVKNLKWSFSNLLKK